MNWNYRIIEHEEHFGLHQVHYNVDGSICIYTEDPAFIWEKDGSVKTAFEMMRAVGDRPILQHADLPTMNGASEARASSSPRTSFPMRITAILKVEA